MRTDIVATRLLDFCVLWSVDVEPTGPYGEQHRICYGDPVLYRACGIVKTRCSSLTVAEKV